MARIINSVFRHSSQERIHTRVITKNELQQIIGEMSTAEGGRYFVHRNSEYFSVDVLLDSGQSIPSSWSSLLICDP